MLIAPGSALIRLPALPGLRPLRSQRRMTSSSAAFMFKPQLKAKQSWADVTEEEEAEKAREQASLGLTRSASTPAAPSSAMTDGDTGMKAGKKSVGFSSTTTKVTPAPPR